jgi:hypothetical protein
MPWAGSMWVRIPHVVESHLSREGTHVGAYSEGSCSRREAFHEEVGLRNQPLETTRTLSEARRSSRGPFVDAQPAANLSCCCPDLLLEALSSSPVTSSDPLCPRGEGDSATARKVNSARAAGES